MDTKRVKGGGGMNWEICINIYTLLYLKYITNGKPLYNTGNYIQHSLVTLMEKKS